MSEAIAFTPPHDGGMTVDDLDLLPESNGPRYELIEGSLLVSPVAGPRHQVIAGRLLPQIREALPQGFEVVETVDVRLDHWTQLVPDLVVASASLLLQEDSKVMAADAALLVEIVSKSSKTMDRITKPSLYASRGVPYYWRVEFLRRLCPEVVAYRLDGADGYTEYARSTDSGHLTVSEPFDTDIDAARLVAEA